MYFVIRYFRLEEKNYNLSQPCDTFTNTIAGKEWKNTWCEKFLPVR